MPDLPPPVLYSINEFARLLSISVPTVRRMLDRGDVTRVKIGASVRIPHAELQRLIAEGTR